MFWGVENSLFLSWGDGYNVDVCIYQNSLNCILKVEVFYFIYVIIPHKMDLMKN